MSSKNKLLIDSLVFILVLMLVPSCTFAQKSKGGLAKLKPIGLVHGKPQKPISPKKLKYLIKVFESDERINWQMPKEIIETLWVKEGYTVADIGAGSGYFTQFFTKSVGKSGKVYATDVDQGFIDFLNKRVKNEEWKNVSVQKTPYGDPELPPKSCDIIFFSDTWHHLSNRPQYLGKLYKALKDDGRLVIVDFRYYQLPRTPPLDHRIPRKQVVKVVRENGFKLHGEFFFLPRQYFLVFKKVILPQ